MAILLVATVGIACVFYLYVFVQFRREQAGPKRMRIQPSTRALQFRKVGAGQRGARRMNG
jgi:hypothetical protein